MSNVYTKPFIRICSLRDVYELSETMRREDVEEIFHSSRSTPLDALKRGFYDSDQSMTIEWRGKVVAIFGVVAMDGAGGSPWMVGTDQLKRCVSLLRECRWWVKGFTKTHQILSNAVWSKNEVHIKWIKWLGFEFNGQVIRNGETFLYFSRRENV